MFGDLALAFGILIFLAGMFVGYLMGKYAEDECPRNILGYNCKGEMCDHSEQTLTEARWWAMKREADRNA